MTIDINGKTIVVEFSYSYEIEAVTRNMEEVILYCGRSKKAVEELINKYGILGIKKKIDLTTTRIVSKDDNAVICEAVIGRHYKDIDNRPKARRICLTRALEICDKYGKVINHHFTKDARKIIWQEYFKNHRDGHSLFLKGSR
jgi:hypothetical protein